MIRVARWSGRESCGHIRWWVHRYADPVSLPRNCCPTTSTRVHLLILNCCRPLFLSSPGRIVPSTLYTIVHVIEHFVTVTVRSPNSEGNHPSRPLPPLITIIYLSAGGKSLFENVTFLPGLQFWTSRTFLTQHTYRRPNVRPVFDKSCQTDKLP